MVKGLGIILETAVGREKAVQAIDVHRECTNCVLTFWVMSQFLHFLGTSRGWADFRDPTAVFRIINPTRLDLANEGYEEKDECPQILR